jgi:phosphopantetheinyl transferase
VIPGISSAGQFEHAEVWWFEHGRSSSLEASGLSILSRAERDRAGRALTDDVRRRFVSARAGVRRLIASRAGCEPGSLVFRVGPHGKPFVETGPHFSWSSSGDMTACAISVDRELGLDVERLRPVPDSAALAHQWFSRDDAATVARARTPDEQSRAFLEAWTRLEAYAKATGDGLVNGPGGSTIDRLGWEFQGLRGPGWVGALVVRRDPAPAGSRSFRAEP